MSVIHHMRHGHAACGLPMPPAEWPEDHKWSDNWDEVTCRGCLSYYPTYEISPDTKSIICLRCKRASSNPNDIAHHYCGYCHVFHDDIWPPARQWWVKSFQDESHPGK
jgi:hypothetical protein